jgi:aminopeptidase N
MNFAMDIPSGDGVGNYGEFALQEKILALAHFYPTVMAYDDDWRLETPSSQGDVIYHDASLYDVTLTAPADLTVAATGATLDKTDLGDGRAEWRLAGGPMRDFNIVASSAYASEARQVDGVQVTSYFLPEDQEGGRLALDYAAKALEVFEDAFGPYPYRELEVAATATEAGGIEYPGLVVIARRLYDPNDRSGFFQAATAHEVAHQWWYNVVGNDQVNVPWLDEAMAQYATYLYYGAAYGPDGSQGFAKSLDDRWARVDYEKIPVGLPVEQYEDREYGAIVYGRGPLFLLALRDQIGEDKMSELVRRYYAENRWEIATPERFQALAEEVAGQDLDALFEEWVYGAKP